MQDGWHHWLAFIAFAAAGSLTPGPNTMISLTTGLNFGWPRVIPHAIGVTIGFAAVLIAAAVGALGAVLALPGATPLLKAAGIAYLLWLAWLIAGSATLGERRLNRPLTIAESALLQLVNPKGWMLAVAMASTFLVESGGGPGPIAMAITLLLGFCAVSNFAWAGLGAGLQRWLSGGRRLLWFNRAMGAALAASALAMLR